MKSGDQILRVHAIVSSLRTNVPNSYEVDEAWVTEFNEAIGRIETAFDTNLDEFKVPREVRLVSLNAR